MLDKWILDQIDQHIRSGLWDIADAIIKEKTEEFAISLKNRKAELVNNIMNHVMVEMNQNTLWTNITIRLEETFKMK